jgi:hypothetical protein
MKRILVILLLTLSGCGLLASGEDQNQSRIITDIRQTIAHFDCGGDIPSQLTILERQVEWFDLYAEGKGTDDVERLNRLFSATLQEFRDRVNSGPVSPDYCEIKLRILKQQGAIIAKPILGR